MNRRKFNLFRWFLTEWARTPGPRPPTLDELQEEAWRLAREYARLVAGDDDQQYLAIEHPMWCRINDIKFGWIFGRSDEVIARQLEDWIKSQREINLRASLERARHAMALANPWNP